MNNHKSKLVAQKFDNARKFFSKIFVYLFVICRSFIVRQYEAIKPVFIKFFAVGIVKRICIVFKYIGIGIFFTAVIPTGICLFLISLGWCFVFGGTLIGMELVLLPIFFIVWILTGKFFFWKAITFIHDETILLYWFREM